MKFEMKCLFAIALALLALFPTSAYSATVSGTLNGPDGILPGGRGQFRLELASDAPVSSFDIAVLVPSGWTITSWDAPGYKKSGIILEKRSRSYKGLSYEAYHWKVPEKLESKATFNFELSLPQTVSIGTVREISSIWTTPENFGTRNLNITAGNPSKKCGDGSCSGDESCSSCPVDCGMCWEPSCGDSVCSPGESYSTCPRDCPAKPTTTKPSGWEIVITPETGSFLGTVGIALGAIVLLGLLILLIAIVLKGNRQAQKPSPLDEARKEIKSPLAREREEALKAAASIAASANSEKSLKDQLKGNFEIKPVERTPVKAKVERPVETIEKKISLLKKAMLRIENIMDDIGKDL